MNSGLSFVLLSDAQIGSLKNSIMLTPTCLVPGMVEMSLILQVLGLGSWSRILYSVVNLSVTSADIAFLINN